MADVLVKISALPHATSFDAAADKIPIESGGATKYVNPDQLTTAPTTNTDDLTSGTLPLARGGTGSDLSATGGAGQFLAQGGVGADLSPRVIAATDLPTTGLTQDSRVVPIGTATDGATITFDLAAHSVWQATLGGNRTLALANPNGSSPFTVILEQDATGSRTVTWWSGISWSGAVAPTLTTTPTKRDVFTFLTLSPGVYLGMSAVQNI